MSILLNILALEMDQDSGGRPTAHSRYVVLQMVEAAVPRRLFAAVLQRNQPLRTMPGMAPPDDPERHYRSHPAQATWDTLCARERRQGLAIDRSGPWRPKTIP